MAILCDFCLADGKLPTAPAEPVRVALNGDAYRVDACERHRKPLDELAAWLAEHVPPLARRDGLALPPAALPTPVLASSAPKVSNHAPERPKAAKTAASGARRGRPPQALPLACPKCGGSAFANRGSLASHARQIHEMTLGELEGKPTPYACPECPKRFTAQSGLTLHTRAHHATSGEHA